MRRRHTGHRHCDGYAELLADEGKRGSFNDLSTAKLSSCGMRDGRSGDYEVLAWRARVRFPFREAWQPGTDTFSAHGRYIA